MAAVAAAGADNDSFERIAATAPEQCSGARIAAPCGTVAPLELVRMTTSFTIVQPFRASMGERVAQDVLRGAEESLTEALEDVECESARYHIRQAAQRVEISRWEQDAAES